MYMYFNCGSASNGYDIQSESAYYDHVTSEDTNDKFERS